jgi:hypothetical protein
MLSSKRLAPATTACVPVCALRWCSSSLFILHVAISEDGRKKRKWKKDLRKKEEQIVVRLFT